MEFTLVSDISNWLGDLDKLQRTGTCKSPKFLKPYHLATLAHVLRHRQLADISLGSKFDSYADTMQLWDALGIPSPYGPKVRLGGRYHPIELLNDERGIEAIAGKIGRLLASVCDTPETVDALQTMLRELIGNCYAHAAVPDGVYGAICAQIWGGGMKGQIALVDSGIGIRTSLKQNLSLWTRLQTENSCAMATEYGITSKPGNGHSGYGLAVARMLLEQNGGMLYVHSGDEVFVTRNGLIQTFETKVPWSGTLIVIEWDLCGRMDIGDVYRQLPLPEGIDDDDFF
ncbi:ATP-binding protein [Massilia sp. TS11]|uniref:ATP-binding protein n=1 Tax=Massilia sp. TS11 TaxID=2908003 RepID=UPI001EDBACFD|nr:ATP-binding protein [Massilia sp. TS11]MCG2585528.1 hypothetical protein [Massilia sp. TS11]